MKNILKIVNIFSQIYLLFHLNKTFTIYLRPKCKRRALNICQLTIISSFAVSNNKKVNHSILILINYSNNYALNSKTPDIKRWKDNLSS